MKEKFHTNITIEIFAAFYANFELSKIYSISIKALLGVLSFKKTSLTSTK